MLPLLTRIDHVGIACRDLSRTIGMYRDTFGLEVVSLEMNEEQGVREAMLAVGGSFAAAGAADLEQRSRQRTSSSRPASGSSSTTRRRCSRCRPRCKY